VLLLLLLHIVSCLPRVQHTPSKHSMAVPEERRQATRTSNCSVTMPTAAAAAAEQQEGKGSGGGGVVKATEKPLSAMNGGGESAEACASPLGAVDEIDTLNLYQIFEKGFNRTPDDDCLSFATPGNVENMVKPVFNYLSYRKVEEMISKIAVFLMNLKLKSPDEEKIKVGMWMSTSASLRILMLACHKANFIVVPVYDALGIENVEKIFKRTEVSIVCVDKQSCYDSICQMKPSLSSVKKIIKTISLIDGTERISSPSEDCIYFDDILTDVTDDALKSFQFPEVKPSELAFLLSSSGSSGFPKNIPVTHTNIACIIKSFRKNFDSISKLAARQHFQITSYMFLPLAHVFGMLVDYVFFALNGRISYPSGHIQKVLKSDLEVVQPQVMTCVPLIMKRAFDATNSTVNKLNIFSRTLFKFAQQTGYIELAFKRPRQAMGGKLLVIACGGSSLDPKLYNFAKTVLGVKMVQGYGLTEGLISCQTMENFTCDLGPPLEFVETKIIDVPEMNYYVANNQGELCVRGASIFTGYYKDDEETAAAFDEDGFFKTGDIVQINLVKKRPHNVEVTKVLKYIDRRKNIFKLSQGEYVVPNDVESLCVNSGTCDMYFVYGDSNRSFCVGIGFINPLNLSSLAVKLDVKIKDFSDDESQIINALKPHIIKRINEQVSKLASFKRPKAWFFTTEMPTIENELLTPTQKMKRYAIKAKFAKELNDLCEEFEKPYLER